MLNEAFVAFLKARRINADRVFQIRI
jgi:hypothetical protein